MYLLYATPDLYRGPDKPIEPPRIQIYCNGCVIDHDPLGDFDPLGEVLRRFPRPAKKLNMSTEFLFAAAQFRPNLSDKEIKIFFGMHASREKYWHVFYKMTLEDANIIGASFLRLFINCVSCPNNILLPFGEAMFTQ